MKMKRISAGTMQEALAIARRELGDDAVLLETKKTTSPKGVTVTFAVDAPDEPLFDDALFDSPADILPFTPDIARPSTAKVEISHPAIGLIEEAFAYHNVPTSLCEKLRVGLNRIALKPDSMIEVAQTALADVLSQTMSFKPIAPAMKTPPPRALMLVGPHGAGKTSAIAKLATELTLQKQVVVLITTDLERLGGTDSLAKLSSILQCAFFIAESRTQLKALLNEHVGKAWVLIDSTGANIYEFGAMKALGELASLNGVEPILTCAAGMDADEAKEMAGVFDFLPIERMIATRLDAVRRLCSLFAVMAAGGYALSNFSNAATPSESCQPLTPIALARLMLRHERERHSQ